MSVVQDVIDDVSTLADTVQSAVVAVATGLDENGARSVSAAMAGATTDARAVLETLETLDEESVLVVDDGAALITLWRWRRQTTDALTALVGQAREVQDLADEIANGKRTRIVVTRAGDTLQRIAARELGDWREWTRILAANPTVSPGALASGLSLLIPERR